MIESRQVFAFFDMPAIDKIYEFLRYADIAGFALVLARLYTGDLHRIYKYFSAYVLMEVLRQAAFSVVPYHTNAFAITYFITEPIDWIFSALVILEVYGLVLKRHPGIATLGRKALTGSMCVSVLLSVCTLLVDFQNSAVKYPVLANFLLLSRLVMISFLLFIVFITMFLLWFPIVLNRNTVLHCCLFAGYFMAKAGGYLAARLALESTALWNAAVRVMIIGCCIVWAKWLTPAGEKIPVTVGHRWDPEQEQRLMAQLDSINRTLLSSAKD